MDNLNRILRLVKGTYEAQSSSGSSSLYRDDVLAYLRGSGSSIDPITNALRYTDMIKLIGCALNQFMLATGRAQDQNIDYILTAQQSLGLLAMPNTSEYFLNHLESTIKGGYIEYMGARDSTGQYETTPTNVVVLPGERSQPKVYKGPGKQTLTIAINADAGNEVLVMSQVRVRFKISRVKMVFQESSQAQNVVQCDLNGMGAVIFQSEPIANVFRMESNGNRENIVAEKWYTANSGLSIKLNVGYCGAIQVDYDIQRVDPIIRDRGDYRLVTTGGLNLFSIIKVDTFAVEAYKTIIRTFLSDMTVTGQFDSLASNDEFCNDLLAKILIMGNQLRPNERFSGF